MRAPRTRPGIPLFTQAGPSSQHAQGGSTLSPEGMRSAEKSITSANFLEFRRSSITAFFLPPQISTTSPLPSLPLLSPLNIESILSISHNVTPSPRSSHVSQDFRNLHRSSLRQMRRQMPGLRFLCATYHPCSDLRRMLFRQLPE